MRSSRVAELVLTGAEPSGVCHVAIRTPDDLTLRNQLPPRYSLLEIAHTQRRIHTYIPPWVRGTYSVQFHGFESCLDARESYLGRRRRRRRKRTRITIRRLVKVVLWGWETHLGAVDKTVDNPSFQVSESTLRSRPADYVV